jgi:hypothetical protein
MIKNSRMGDVVAFTGSTRTFKPTEGIGVWTYDFAGWRARNALKLSPVPRVGPAW